MEGRLRKVIKELAVALWNMNRFYYLELEHTSEYVRGYNYYVPIQHDEAYE